MDISWAVHVACL